MAFRFIDAVFVVGDERRQQPTLADAVQLRAVDAESHRRRQSLAAGRQRRRRRAAQERVQRRSWRVVKNYTL